MLAGLSAVCAWLRAGKPAAGQARRGFDPAVGLRWLASMSFRRRVRQGRPFLKLMERRNSRMKAEEIFREIAGWCETVKVLSAGVDGHTEAVLLHPETMEAMVCRGDTAPLTDEAAKTAADMVRAARWPGVALVNVSPAGVAVFPVDFDGWRRFESGMPVGVSLPAFRQWDVFQRPDGRIIALMTKLSPTTWGADFLEDPEGHPDPDGYLACNGQVVSEEELRTYRRRVAMDVKAHLKDLIDAAHRANDHAAIHFRRHDGRADAEPMDREQETEAWELMLHHCNQILTHCYTRR